MIFFKENRFPIGGFCHFLAPPTMAKGQKQQQQAAEQRSREAEARAADADKKLSEGTPEEKARRERYAKRRQAIDRGDIQNAPDFVSSAAKPAERQRQRQARMNATASGTAGIAMNYANPNEVAKQQQILGDMFDRDAGAQLEGDWKNYVQDTDLGEQGIINVRNSVEGTRVAQANNQVNQNANLAFEISKTRSSFLPGIIGMGIGGASSMFRFNYGG